MSFNPISQDTSLQPSRHAYTDVFLAPDSTRAKENLLPFPPQNFAYLDHYISVHDSEVETKHPCWKWKSTTILSHFFIFYSLSPWHPNTSVFPFLPLLFLLSLLPLVPSFKIQCTGHKQWDKRLDNHHYWKDSFIGARNWKNATHLSPRGTGKCRVGQEAEESGNCKPRGLLWFPGKAWVKQGQWGQQGLVRITSVDSETQSVVSSLEVVSHIKKPDRLHTKKMAKCGF